MSHLHFLEDDQMALVLRENMLEEELVCLGLCTGNDFDVLSLTITKLRCPFTMDASKHASGTKFQTMGRYNSFRS